MGKKKKKGRTLCINHADVLLDPPSVIRFHVEQRGNLQGAIQPGSREPGNTVHSISWRIES